MACRKNYRDLSDTERARFVLALKHLKATGVIDQFADDHETYFHEAHHSSHFFPWHREFLRRFEVALRTVHPDITIPYWNSTVDRSAADPLWDDAFLGQFDALWDLDRTLGAETLPSPENVQTALERGSYDALWPYVEGEALHNPPHRWVGGVMSTAASPGDPVFYLHHCWIDMLWAQWQALHSGAGFVGSEPGRGLNDAMQPWPTTPAEVLDHRSIGLYDYPAGFQPDPGILSLDTPVINFLDVPEGETRLGAAVLSMNVCEPVHLELIGPPAPGSGFAVVNAVAPGDPAIDSKARMWFTYLGTSDGDTATASVVILCEETGQEFIVELTANTVRRPTAAIVMVLDQSNSMNFESGIGPGIEREDVLKFSAPPAVVVLDEINAMAVASFDHDAHLRLGMTPAAGAGRLAIHGAIAAYAPNPEGWTSIGEGVALAHDILEDVSGHDIKAMVVLTDGHENHGPHTRRSIADMADQIASLNGRVFAIGLGRPEVLHATALQDLCEGNNGYMVMTGDLTPDTTYRLAKFYQEIFAGVTNHDIVLDPENHIQAGQEHRIPFWLNEADITAKAILLSPVPGALRYVLETPAGELIDPALADAHPMAGFHTGSQVAMYRFGLPIPLGAASAHAGRWHVRLTVNDIIFRRYLASLGNFPAQHARVASRGILYSVSVQAYSNLRMRARLTQTGNEPGAIVTVRSLLSEYGVPLASAAACHVELTRPDLTQALLPMTQVDTGVFEVSLAAPSPGIYRMRVMAQGTTLRGGRFTREQTLTAAVWRGGDRPIPPTTDEPGERDERLCHLIDCLLRKRTIRAALQRASISVAELRGCLEQYCRKPAPGQAPRGTAGTLDRRLGALIDDRQVLEAVLQEIRRELD